MKLTAKQIPTFLKAPTQNCNGVLIYGPDEGQVREYGRQIAKTIVADPNDPFSVAELTEDQLKSEPTKLADELFAMNMLGGQRLVRVDASSETVGKLLTEIIEEGKPLEAYLLVCSGDLPPRSSIRQLFEKQKDFSALPCYKDENYKIENLVNEKFREAGIRADRAVIGYMCANMGSDRRVTLNELEKIVLYVGDAGTLTMEDAIALVGNSAELTLDDLVAAVAGGSLKMVETILQKLLRESVNPVQIVRTLQRHFQKLHYLSALMREKGMSADQAIGELKPKVFFKLVPQYKNQLALWKMPAIESALALLTEAEKSAKSNSGAADSQLQHALLQIMVVGQKSRRKAA